MILEVGVTLSVDRATMICAAANGFAIIRLCGTL